MQDPAPEHTAPTPEQWIRMWNDATPEQRLKWATLALHNAETARRCFEMDHQGAEGDLVDLRDRLKVTSDACNEARNTLARVRLAARQWSVADQVSDTPEDRAYTAAGRYLLEILHGSADPTGQIDDPSARAALDPSGDDAPARP